MDSHINNSVDPLWYSLQTTFMWHAVFACFSKFELLLFQISGFHMSLKSCNLSFFRPTNVDMTKSTPLTYGKIIAL